MSTTTAAPSDGHTTTATIAKGLEDRLRMFVDYGDCTSLKSHIAEAKDYPDEDKEDVVGGLSSLAAKFEAAYVPEAVAS